MSKLDSMTAVEKEAFYVARAAKTAATKAKNKAIKLQAETAVAQDALSTFQRQMTDVKAQLVSAPDTELAEMFLDGFQAACEFAPDQIQSCCYRVANMAAFRAQTSLVDLLAIKPNEHGELTAKQLAYIADKQAIVDGSAIVYQYLMDIRNFEADNVERMVERKITEATTKKLFTEVGFVEAGFARKVRIEAKRVERANGKMSDEAMAYFVEDLRKKEDRVIERANLRAQGRADFSNQLIETHGEYIERELRKTFTTAVHGKADDISELPEGIAVSLTDSIRKVFDNRSEYINSQGKIQWLEDRIFGHLSLTMSESYKDTFEIEVDTIYEFLDKTLDPLIAKMYRAIEQHKRSNRNSNDAAEMDLHRKAGDGEEPEIVR